MALLEQMTRRISTSWFRNGMNSDHAERHNVTIAG